jgi:hypothetical protein
MGYKWHEHKSSKKYQNMNKNIHNIFMAKEMKSSPNACSACNPVFSPKQQMTITAHLGMLDQL